MPEKEESEKEEIFTCTLEQVENMEDWFKKEYSDSGTCRPCFLRTVTELYMDVLEDAGHKELSNELSQEFENGDILTVAKKLDSIKASVGDETKKALQVVNCMCQEVGQ